MTRMLDRLADAAVVERRALGEEVVLHLDGDGGRVALPVAIAADRQADRRAWSSCGVLQHVAADRRPRHPAAAAAADPDVHEADVVGEYQRALAAGDVEAAASAAADATASRACPQLPPAPL
jgi:hypothetical protein